ncbi:MAG: hypothetical protein Q9222_002754 [Ikaeria aurantiellina]
MSSCSGSNCSSTLPSSGPTNTPPDNGISAEVVVTISFGIVMFILALLALLQGRKRRRRQADEERQNSHWPQPHNAIVRRQNINQLSSTQFPTYADTYYNFFLSTSTSPDRTPSASSPPIRSLQHIPPRLQLPPPPPPIHLNTPSGHPEHTASTPSFGQILAIPHDNSTSHE